MMHKERLLVVILCLLAATPKYYCRLPPLACFNEFRDRPYLGVTRSEVEVNGGGGGGESNAGAYTSLAFSNNKNFLVATNDEGEAQVYTLSKPVPSLMHLCRSQIRAVTMERYRILNDFKVSSICSHFLGSFPTKMPKIGGTQSFFKCFFGSPRPLSIQRSRGDSGSVNITEWGLVLEPRASEVGALSTPPPDQGSNVMFIFGQFFN